MSVAYDILLGADGDLPIETNDLAIGQSDNQHIKDCLNSFPGYYKQFPQNGVGIRKFQKARINPQALKSKIEAELKRDGYTIEKLVVKARQGVYSIDLNTSRQ